MYWMDKWPYNPMPWEIAVTTSLVSSLLAFLGAFSNGLVIYVIPQIKRFQETMDLLILSLCFTDFLSSVVVQPQLISFILSSSRVAAEQFLFYHVSGHFVLMAGSLNLLFLALNRYLSIKFPFFYANHVTNKGICGCLVTIFTASLAIVIWVFLHGQSESLVFPVLIGVVFIFTICLQVMIFMIAQAKNCSIRRQIMAVQYNQGANDASHTSRRTNAQLFKANRTILYICAVFIATWLPLIVFRVSYVIHGDLTVYLRWVHIFKVVLQVHSCINPFLYVLRTPRVKQVLMRIFRRMLFKSRAY